MQAALAWGDANLAAATTGCLIHADNAASIGVAAKCGYHEICRLSYKDQPTILYRRAVYSKRPKARARTR